MTPQEQAAFVVAYENHVAMADVADVIEFVRRYASGEDLDYSHDYTNIMDALGMWNEGIKWALSKQIEEIEA